LFPGLWVYRNVITPEMDIINRLESAILDSKGMHTWKEATVGYREKMPDYRDCVDFKWKKFENHIPDKYNQEVDAIWQDVYDAQAIALNDYSSFYNIELKYWEAMNFIKYGEGQHFSYHSDHGWSYISTVSMVAYINDDYEEGGLRFDKLDLTIKPKAGDLYIFPSTYLFSHAALPVKSGLKY
jgi:Rps23 Pro-64 3,4-dihydroxylase Tpa1-like proline 4-hydroxylase